MSTYVIPDGKRLLGVHVVAEGATDLVHVGELALINGNDIDVFLDNILNFPTLGEAYRIAALDIANQRSERYRRRAECRLHDSLDDSQRN